MVLLMNSKTECQILLTTYKMLYDTQTSEILAKCQKKNTLHGKCSVWVEFLINIHNYIGFFPCLSSLKSTCYDCKCGGLHWREAFLSLTNDRMLAQHDDPGILNIIFLCIGNLHFIPSHKVHVCEKSDLCDINTHAYITDNGKK